MTLDFQSLPKEPPSAPRAMTYPTKDELEFSSSFNLLRAFGLFHGDDGDDGDNDIGRAEDSNFTEIELLQGYLIGVSYLCDIEKGGNTVTAAALSNDLELYLAANNDLHPKIQSFISRVVLEELRTDSVESRHKVAERILREAVQRAGKRMEFYFRKLKDIWGKCRVSVEDQFRGTTLISSIQSLTEDQDYYNLTVKCYNARGELLDDLNRAANGREDWKHLIHYIGRLGAHKYHVLKIVSAFSRLKFLREIKRVDFVQSSNRRALTLPESSLDFARLSKKVCDDLEKPQKEREALFLSLMRTYFCNPKPDEPLRENQTISTHFFLDN